MTADELKAFAKKYCDERKPDTAEICGFVEWAYRQEGVELEAMSLLAFLDGNEDED